MYVCIYVYVYVYIYILACVYIYIYHVDCSTKQQTKNKVNSHFLMI